MINIINPSQIIQIPIPEKMRYTYGAYQPEIAKSMPIRKFRLTGDVYLFNTTEVPVYYEEW
jgi:hypothetical protein